MHNQFHNRPRRERDGPVTSRRPPFTISSVRRDRKSHSDGALPGYAIRFAIAAWAGSLRYYGRELVDMLRDLTPARRKSRYGDIDFDFDHGVDTTWATVSLRTRVREWLSGGQYQPSEPTLFREIIESLPVPPDGFTFIDLGSGKGRTLLMASSFPFRRIIGMELLEELNAIAVQTIALSQRRAALFRDRVTCGRRALLRLSRRAYRVCICSILSRDTSGERCWRICRRRWEPRRARSSSFITILFTRTSRSRKDG